MSVSKSRIKILYLSSFSDLDKGGQISLYNLVKRLDRTVFEPSVLCPNEGAFTALLSRKGIPIKFLDFPLLRVRNSLQILRAALLFRKTVLKGGFSLIHTDAPRNTFLGSVSLIFTRKKVVWHVRVSNRDPIFDRINPCLVSKIICVSQAVKRRFAPCRSSKCVVVYNGVDPFKFFPKSSRGQFKQEVGISSDNILVLTIMQVIPEKGAEEFVQAAVSLCQKKTNVSFAVVGVGSDDAYIEKLRGITDPFKDRVLFVGYRRDIADILNDTDIFVLPSWREGLPRVVIEAMACGVPVVGTDVEGTNEAVVHDETGLLVPARNVDKLTKSIERLIDDQRLREQFGKNGSKMAHGFFGIEKHVKKLEKLYKELMLGGC